MQQVSHAKRRRVSPRREDGQISSGGGNGEGRRGMWVVLERERRSNTREVNSFPVGGRTQEDCRRSCRAELGTWARVSREGSLAGEAGGRKRNRG